MFNRKTVLQIVQKKSILGVGLGVVTACLVFWNLRSESPQEPKAPQENVAEPLEPKPLPKMPEHVRGIHLTSWVAGSKKARQRIDSLLNETELNTVVIAIKEHDGEVYIPGVPMAESMKAYVRAIPDLESYIAHLKKEGIYTIARIVVFKDSLFANKHPEWAVKNPDGSIWKDYRGMAWMDPYQEKVWDYNLDVASRAIVLGFDEIQFDYIRFPSDGNLKNCRYSYQQHSSTSQSAALDNFLKKADAKLKPMGARISIDVFGLTPSVADGMGIGQRFTQIVQWADFVSPMMYPSHYANGEYGIANPNSEPYRVVYRTIADAKHKLGENYKRLRPYLQDFSLGYRYGPAEVRAQIQAAEDQGIKDWLLWDPKCQYSRNAFKDRSGNLPPEANPMRYLPKEPKVSSGTVKSPGKKN